MGMTTIPFYADNIIMKEVIEATHLTDFEKEGLSIKALGCSRLNNSKLEKILGLDEYVLTSENGDFVRFEG